MTLDNFITPIPLTDPPPSAEDDCVMASASSTSARNLFQDSKVRLAERVQVSKVSKDPSIFTAACLKSQCCQFQANITSIGSLARQIQRGSKSQEILQQTVGILASDWSTDWQYWAVIGCRRCGTWRAARLRWSRARRAWASCRWWWRSCRASTSPSTPARTRSAKSGGGKGAVIKGRVSQMLIEWLKLDNRRCQERQLYFQMKYNTALLSSQYSVSSGSWSQSSY